MIPVAVGARRRPARSVPASSSEKIRSSSSGGLGAPAASVMPKCISKGWWL